MKSLGGFLSRYAKACVPVILASSAIAQHWVETGHLDRIAAGGAAAGLITALAVALTANGPAAPAPILVPAKPVQAAPEPPADEHPIVLKG